MSASAGLGSRRPPDEGSEGPAYRDVDVSKGVLMPSSLKAKKKLSPSNLVSTHKSHSNNKDERGLYRDTTTLYVRDDRLVSCAFQGLRDSGCKRQLSRNFSITHF